MMVKVGVEVDKTFDLGKLYSKDWKDGDLEEFFKGEGEYLDRLAKVLDNKGRTGDIYTVTYTVTVSK